MHVADSGLERTGAVTLDTIYRDYFKAKQPKNEFVVLEQAPGQKFSEFYTKFTRLVFVRQVLQST